MNVDDGYMRHLTDEERALNDRRLMEQLAGQREVLVPRDEEEALVNMTRQQRRAWAREQMKEVRALGRMLEHTADQQARRHDGMNRAQRRGHE